MKKQNILMVEDAFPMARVYQEYLATEPYDIDHVDTGKAALTAISNKEYDAILLDMKLPDMNGLEILQKLRTTGNDCAVIVITANASINVAVDAMKAGGSDFLVKPFNADRLRYTLKNCLEKESLSKVVGLLNKKYSKGEYSNFIGSSIAMKAVYEIIENAAPSQASVFITGASGTGKELCAEALHKRSARVNGNFVAINCAAIPKDLIESEIFGHVKGAFTGANSNRDGAATLADGGTLFLDEICEMDISLQSKLLRLIQNGSFQKVGSSKAEQVSLRFISATNRNPWEEVQEGRFREDLYYRLHVIPIHLPNLAQRDNDPLTLADEFLKRFNASEGKDFKRFDERSKEYILDYHWPGNVRELQNVIRNIVVLNNTDEVKIEMFPTSQASPPQHKLKPTYSGINATTNSLRKDIELRPMWQIEDEMIEVALKETNNNVPRAAAILEVSPSTIYRRLKEKKEEAS